MHSETNVYINVQKTGSRKKVVNIKETAKKVKCTLILFTELQLNVPFPMMLNQVISTR